LIRYPVEPAAASFLTSEMATAPADFRLGQRVDIDLPKPDPHTGKPLPLLPAPFRTMLLGDGQANISGVLELIGMQHIVKPGDGGVLVVMLARRKTGLSHEAFRTRWLDGHARFGLATSASGYRQLHPDTPPANDGFDGAGLVFFRDLDHVAKSRAAPEIARAATADEMEFIDHGRSMLMMFRMAPVKPA
jgi:hypothetical protein